VNYSVAQECGCGASSAESAAVWDIKSYRATDKFRERTTAETRVDRQKVTFALGNCDLIQWEQKVPHIQNAKGGELFLYPGFIVYRAAREAFSVIDFHDLKSNAALVKFEEEQGVPKDSKVIGQAWAKANKDGSRDKRFANNYQIPVVLYASLSLKSDTGLWEEFQFSNPERLQFFLALKAEALYLADRAPEAIEPIVEAELLIERFEGRHWYAELHLLRGVSLAAIGSAEPQIEASFCKAIRIAKEQKSISLEKRAEATYAEYRRQKASGSGGRGIRLPLC
jgi:hypothetical protein